MREWTKKKDGEVVKTYSPQNEIVARHSMCSGTKGYYVMLYALIKPSDKTGFQLSIDKSYPTVLGLYCSPSTLWLIWKDILDIGFRKMERSTRYRRAKDLRKLVIDKDIKLTNECIASVFDEAINLLDANGIKIVNGLYSFTNITFEPYNATDIICRKLVRHQLAYLIAYSCGIDYQFMAKSLEVENPEYGSRPLGCLFSCDLEDRQSMQIWRREFRLRREMVRKAALMEFYGE